MSCGFFTTEAQRLKDAKKDVLSKEQPAANCGGGAYSIKLTFMIFRSRLSDIDIDVLVAAEFVQPQQRPINSSKQTIPLR